MMTNDDRERIERKLREYDNVMWRFNIQTVLVLIFLRLGGCL